MNFGEILHCISFYVISILSFNTDYEQMFIFSSSVILEQTFSQWNTSLDCVCVCVEDWTFACTEHDQSEVGQKNTTQFTSKITQTELNWTEFTTFPHF
jgi:hypothetical protein